MADYDQIALDAATKIMDLVYGQMPVGGSVQLKAGVQLIVADALVTQSPAVGVDVSDEMVERACDAWDKHLPDEPICHNGAMRVALTAVLRTGGGA